MASYSAKAAHSSVDMCGNHVFSVSGNDSFWFTTSLDEWQWQNTSYQYHHMNTCDAAYTNWWLVWLLGIWSNHEVYVIKLFSFYFSSSKAQLVKPAGKTHSVAHSCAVNFFVLETAMLHQILYSMFYKRASLQFWAKPLNENSKFP